MDKPALRITFIFGVVYFLYDIFSVLLLFSWSSFGGEKSLKVGQKIVGFFSSFPGSQLGLTYENLWLYFIANTLFWSALFYGVLVLVKKIRQQKKA
ncbi:MAG: hypothetical protein AAF620_14920 [Bacteroidota bacterium]